MSKKRDKKDKDNGDYFYLHKEMHKVFRRFNSFTNHKIRLNYLKMKFATSHYENFEDYLDQEDELVARRKQQKIDQRREREFHDYRKKEEKKTESTKEKSKTQKIYEDTPLSSVEERILRYIQTSSDTQISSFELVDRFSLTLSEIEVVVSQLIDKGKLEAVYDSDNCIIRKS